MEEPSGRAEASRGTLAESGNENGYPVLTLRRRVGNMNEDERIQCTDLLRVEG
jgi:hypothetical protein